MNCVICMGELNDPIQVTCCNQQFCSSCLNSWVDVKNSCPLCNTSIGQTKINKLTVSNQQFDNGSLILQNQLSSCLQRFSYLRIILRAKRETARNLKNQLRMEYLTYAEIEAEKIELALSVAGAALAEGDRATVTLTLQGVMERLLEAEAILNGEADLEENDYDSSEDDEDEEDYKCWRKESLNEMRKPVKNVRKR